MRQIDADKLKKPLVDWLNWYSGPEAVKGIVREIVEEIDNAKTNEAEPVRHGRWDFSGRYKFKDGRTAIRCTECGCSLHMAEFLKYTWNYCPVCGARMDGGAEK